MEHQSVPCILHNGSKLISLYITWWSLVIYPLSGGHKDRNKVAASPSMFVLPLFSSVTTSSSSSEANMYINTFYTYRTI